MMPEVTKPGQRGHRYISGCLNIAYLSGFVRSPNAEEGTFLLQQNNNLEQALPIHVTSTQRVPRDKTPVTLLCHLYGQKNEDGTHGLLIRAFDIQKPSVRAMPAMTTWLRGKNGQDDFKPFSAGKISDKADLAEGDDYTSDEQVMQEILSATRGRLDTRLGENSNVVMLAGFIDSLAVETGNAHQTSSPRYGSILLRQHEDTDLSVPLRLHPKKSSDLVPIMRELKEGVPVSVAGQIRMKILPNEDGSVKSRSLHVRINDVYRAESGTDILTTPPWWRDMRDRLVRAAEDRKARLDAAKKEREEALNTL